MTDSPRGAVKPGTVGVLGSGRLVYVERVTRYVAFFISLPQQHVSTLGDDIRYTGHSRAIASSPYVELTVLKLEDLSPINRMFVENGCKPLTPDQLPPPPKKETTQLVIPSGFVKRGGQKRIEVVGSPDGLDHRAVIVFNIIKELNKPMLEQIVSACLQHPKFQSPSSHRAARWFANDLIKRGVARFVE